MMPLVLIALAAVVCLCALHFDWLTNDLPHWLIGKKTADRISNWLKSKEH